MSATVLRTVQNRDGTIAHISDVPVSWWSENQASGFADPKHLAPDPDQPRKSLTPLRLEELYQSIEERGVREPIAVTPRHLAPWARVEEKHGNAYFLIVSGHRRWNGAGRASLEAVPIRVVVYNDEADHREDAALLNGIRDNLNELEQGYEFARLHKLGRTYAQLSDRFGMDVLTIHNYINLTKLHPDIQKMVIENSRKRRLLPLYPAYTLGSQKPPEAYQLEEMFGKFEEIVPRREVIPDTDIDDLDEDGRRFAMQKLIVAVILKRHLNSTRAADFIREQTLPLRKTGAGHRDTRSQRFEPHKRKDLLTNVFKQVSQSAIIDWPPEEFRRIFENSSREEVEEYLKELQNAKDVLAHVEKLLTVIRNVKHPTRPEVMTLMQRKKVTA